MAGYYDNSFNDACYLDYQAGVNDYISDYYLNRNANMRDVDKCHDMGLSVNCQFRGPKDAQHLRTTRESFLQGRGHLLTECPEGGVIPLPDSLFDQPQSPRPCEDGNLQPLHTRLPKSCGNTVEVDITQYAFMPGAYQVGYDGYNAVCDTFMQSREDARSSYKAKRGRCRNTYGSYD